MTKKVNLNTYPMLSICTDWFIGMQMTNDFYLLGKNIKSTETRVGSLVWVCESNSGIGGKAESLKINPLNAVLILKVLALMN